VDLVDRAVHGIAETVADRLLSVSTLFDQYPAFDKLLGLCGQRLGTYLKHFEQLVPRTLSFRISGDRTEDSDILRTVETLEIITEMLAVQGVQSALDLSAVSAHR
jgi:hypothetical protein